MPRKSNNDENRDDAENKNSTSSNNNKKTNKTNDKTNDYLDEYINNNLGANKNKEKKSDSSSNKSEFNKLLFESIYPTPPNILSKYKKSNDKFDKYTSKKTFMPPSNTDDDNLPTNKLTDKSSEKYNTNTKHKNNKKNNSNNLKADSSIIISLLPYAKKYTTTKSKNMKEKEKEKERKISASPSSPIYQKKSKSSHYFNNDDDDDYESDMDIDDEDDQEDYCDDDDMDDDDYDDDEEDEEDDDDSYYDNDSDSDTNDNITVSSVGSSKSNKTDLSINTHIEIPEENKNKNIDNTVLYEQIKNIHKLYPKNDTIKKCISLCKSDIEKQKKNEEKYQQKQRKRNINMLMDLTYKDDTNTTLRYFKKLQVDKQKEILKELKNISNSYNTEKPYLVMLSDKEFDIPLNLKAIAYNKISQLEISEPGTDEYNRTKNWIDNFMRIPFNKYHPFPVSINTSTTNESEISDNKKTISKFISDSQNILDSVVYGMEDAKIQMMQLIGKLIVNPDAVGTAIGICGPPGVGKTSLIREGFSKILKRPFYMITLGGATDGSFLNGHSYTYVGSVWGRIVQILIECKCMNPIIYFGELDKVSSTPHGQEITGILTHLTDTSQNSQFHDKYFSEVDFDLSKATFIFDYNDEKLIDPILRDRLYKIHVKGYSINDKQIIASKFLLPKIYAEMKFNESDVIISNQIIAYIIENYCEKEEGVRNLKRAFEIIFKNLNLIRLDDHNEIKTFEKMFKLNNIRFPLTLTSEIISKFLAKPTNNTATHLMYV